jgi:hypothetical protein
LKKQSRLEWCTGKEEERLRARLRGGTTATYGEDDPVEILVGFLAALSKNN